MNVLLISRGRGYGHAITDVAIIEAAQRYRNDITWQIASYQTGYQTFLKAGYQAVDLDLPTNNPFFPTLHKVRNLIRKLKPDVVISHEEFAAIAAAVYDGYKSIFISTWLPSAGTFAAESLEGADGICVLEDPGIFPVPEGIRCPVYCVGPVIREMDANLNDRESLRRKLGIPVSAVCWLVIPGGWATESTSPILRMVLEAFAAYQAQEKHLIWLGGADTTAIECKLEGIPNARCIKYSNQIGEWMAASDVILTKGTHGIVTEASYIGVPTVSISFRQNPIDEVLVPRIRNNTHLHGNAINATILCESVRKACMSKTPPRREIARNRDIAAQCILAVMKNSIRTEIRC